MLTIGVYPNMDKTGMKTFVKQAVEHLLSAKVAVMLPDSIADKCGFPELKASQELMCSTISLAVTLGGDGTILHVARELAKYGLPVCGINMGNLGFLTAAEHHELLPALNKLLTGEYLVEQRLMLTASVIRNFEPIFTATALNDVVITNGSAHRPTRLNVYVDESIIAAYPADGLILATPTGATGYSLSAGGPVVSPYVEAIILTPICPHTLYSRSVVVSCNETIKVCPQPDQANIGLTIDGQQKFCLESGDFLYVSKATDKAGLIRFSNKSYYHTLRNKLRRGEIDATN